ncbi:MAG: hypothetical protein A2474_01310 [Elusimicrobia bacterium RIFOXYC2_FULL_34_12]|nr:MAG: hypothetical protein A2474_01310 [Elusimicrobia bacterium RIFOXYC2_FULL_34_12]OGS38439.1 MAG: hypothetical protein A2551_02530 [Elusimicrobia bacterium RIFOXYD2_FULL_34_30]HAM38546.1 hypothetical protein [Elusimicrobiota bacterium]
MLSKVWIWLKDVFSDEEDPNEPIYDPVHIATMLVLTIFGISILFWLFWALLVYKGGLLDKIIPFFKVIFTSKTLADFGYEGYPYEMGIFDGWITNIVALLFLFFLIWRIRRIFRHSIKL